MYCTDIQILINSYSVIYFSCIIPLMHGKRICLLTYIHGEMFKREVFHMQDITDLETTHHLKVGLGNMLNISEWTWKYFNTKNKVNTQVEMADMYNCILLHICCL